MGTIYNLHFVVKLVTIFACIMGIGREGNEETN